MQNAARQTVSRGFSIPAPVEGWDAVSPLASMKPTRAVVLDNWFPQPGYVQLRNGFVEHADGMGTDPVETLMVYNALVPANNKMFAVTGEEIWDCTAHDAATTTTIDTLANNRFQWTNFTTSGGKFLWICNGADAPRHYNGSVWDTPTITGITASDIVHVNPHKNRLWFVLNQSTKAAYLPVGSVAGAATTFELGGLFSQGGYLVAMATWTRDGGAGADDLAVFISSEGQLAIYQGTDPASADTWSLIGVFDISPPIGRRCFTKVGGDVAIVTLEGVLPLSKVLGVDRAAAENIAITARINNAMNEAAQSYKDNFGWEIVSYPKETMAILNVPLAEGSLQHQYVMNTLTGAWCRFIGMNANCWVVFNDELHFGGNDGIVYHADSGGNDNGATIDAIGQTAYNYFKSPGRLKQFHMMQPLLSTDTDARPSVGISTDFQDNAVLGTPSVAESQSALWDSALWDSDTWATVNSASTDWTVVTGQGQSASVHFRAASNSAGASIMSMNGFNLIYELGGFL